MWFKKKEEKIEQINDLLRYRDGVLEFRDGSYWSSIKYHISNLGTEKSFIEHLSYNNYDKETEEYLIDAWKEKIEEKEELKKRIRRKTKEIKKKLK